jgi:hypothetical protein
MHRTSPTAADTTAHPWPLILGLVGVDYFSTLAYLPSIAAEAAGPWAPFAAAGVVVVTFIFALPIYWYVAGRSPDGRGAAGLLEDNTPGWRGKLIVLTLLGFAAADFVITRSLSLADATIHLLHNPHGQQLLTRWPDRLFQHDHKLWPPLERLIELLGTPQIAVTLIISILSFTLWQLLKRGVSRRLLVVTATALSCYLLLTAAVITSAIVYLVDHPHILSAWAKETFALPNSNAATGAATSGAWLPWLKIALWSFPQMALGLSGFEMILNVVPRISSSDIIPSAKNVFPSEARNPPGLSPTASARIRNTRKLMLAAASIMAIYLITAVAVTTILVPHAELMPGGSACHRALAYIAHGSPLAGEATGHVHPIFGHYFGDLYDLAAALVLCLAGVSVTMGLQYLLPHYLNRLGMDGHWAGQSGVIMHVLNFVILLVIVVFHASPSLQQWAYATSVLVLLTGAAVAATKDLATNRLACTAQEPNHNAPSARDGLVASATSHESTPNDARSSPALHPLLRIPLLTLAAAAAAFFLAMTALTAWINYSGLVIAVSFVTAIVVSSFVSRWLRCTELRFAGFDFADADTEARWNGLRQTPDLILIPHRPGLISISQRYGELQRDYRINSTDKLVFIESILGDPSNFYQRPLMKIETETDPADGVGHMVIRLSKCVSIAHVLAATCIELSRDGHRPPEIIFGWSHESPIAANVNFLLLGQGNIPWMVKELVRAAIPDPKRQPRIRIG